MTQDGLRAQTMQRVFRRLLPLLILMYVVACIDKANLSYAALQMNDDLGLTPSVFGLGAGLYFIVYTLLEVPGNLLLHRLGARRWIARIMLSWGIVASLMAAVVGPRSFYAMRMLLGAAEAGFYPGILFYLTLWFPKRERVTAMAWFTCGLPVALVLGGLLSSVLLSLDGGFGLRGWQWMFIVEGLPAIGLSFYVLFRLPDGPRTVSWLSEAQRDWLCAQLASEATGTAPATAHARHDVARILLDRRMLTFSAALFCMMMGNLGLSVWLPQIVKQVSGYGIGSTGLLAAIPYVFATLAMIFNARHSARTGERRLHVALPALAGALALALSACTSNPLLALCAVTVAASGVLSAISIFFSMPAALVSGAQAAAAIALINCLGNIGGFVGPYVIGITREITGSFSDSLLILAAFLALGALIVLTQGGNAALRRCGRRAG
jgi:ACS family tartrate transporter-like MFS transporter